MADNGIDVRLRPHVEVKGYSNPGYLVNGMLSDRKAPEGFNSFRTLIRDLKRQCENKLTNPKNSNYIMALDLINIKNVNINNLILELNRNINTDRYKRLDKIIFINKGKVVSLNRKEIVNRNCKDLLKIQ